MKFAKTKFNVLFRRLGETLFPSPTQSIVSLLVLAGCVWCAWHIIDWAIIRSVILGSSDDCRAVNPYGACWAVVVKKIGFIALGRYYEAEAWRPHLVIALFLVAVCCSYFRGTWGRPLAAIWYAFIVVSHLLLAGGWGGLAPVPADQWGGFVLTIVLATTGLGIALPIGILLALARYSGSPLIKSLSVVYIEVVRGIPLVAVLFQASVMLPLLMPDFYSPSKVSRACLAIGFFTAAYIAEVVRGGLQTIPKGQLEASRALGLNYLGMTVKVILPQALRVTIPPIINTMVAIFKDTSLVVVVGLIDFLGVVRLVTVEPEWKLFYLEPLIFAGAVYFVFCWYFSRVGFRIERAALRSTAK